MRTVFLRLAPLGVLTTLAGLLVFPPLALAQWEGSITQQDGVPRVSNPATPLESMLRLEPTPLWEIGGYSEEEGEFFGVISQIAFDSHGDLYLLDRQLNEVKVFSRDGEYLRTIGREGEGPGEFRRPGTLFFLPSGDLAVVQSFPGKLITLTPDGDPAPEFSLRSAEDGGFRGLMDARFRGGTLVFLGMNFTMGEGKMTRTTALAHVGLDGEEVARFTEETTTNNMGNMVIRERESMGMPWNVLPDGRIIASQDFSYALTLWNPDGSTDRVVTREYDTVERSKSEMEEVKKRLGSRIMMRGRGGRIKPTIEVESQERDIEDIVVTEDGHIWVLSSRGSKKKPDDVTAIYDVFDGEGRYLQQVSLAIDADLEEDRLIFAGDRLFVIKQYAAAARAQHSMGDEEDADDEEDEEEAEPVSVVCYHFDWAPQAVATPAR